MPRDGCSPAVFDFADAVAIEVGADRVSCAMEFIISVTVSAEFAGRNRHAGVFSVIKEADQARFSKGDEKPCPLDGSKLYSVR